MLLFLNKPTSCSRCRFITGIRSNDGDIQNNNHAKNMLTLFCFLGRVVSDAITVAPVNSQDLIFKITIKEQSGDDASCHGHIGCRSSFLFAIS